MVLLMLLAAAPTAAAAAPQTVEFPTSCPAPVAADFNRAVTLLHSFEYPDAEAAFRAILEQQPDCAMARWGVAMTLWHPLWEPPAESVLATGAAMLAGIDRTGLSDREAGYVDALDSFYADYRTRPHQERVQDYARHMHQLYLAHREDPEAAVFTALALVASADPHDKSYCRQFEAAGLLNWVRATQPNHPGVLHYLIHAYDYPTLAPLALDAALIYAEVAPDSAHAQHMPSHIFTRLGMWERSIASNHHSIASAAAYTSRAALPGFYDEGVHSMDYLMYALLQVGDDAGAQALLAQLESLGRPYPANFKAAYTFAAAPARYAVERRDWRAASNLELPRDFPWENFRWAESINHFARGLGAARSGNVDQARRELAAVTDIAPRLPAETPAYWREEVQVQGDVIASWIALAGHDEAAALRQARAAVEREEAVDKHPVTPGEVVPARELLADMLLELGQAPAALTEYRNVLARAPNRASAMMGAARAAVAMGDTQAAAGYYQAVVKQTSARGADLERFRPAHEFPRRG